MATWEKFKMIGSRGFTERRVSLNPRGVFTLNQLAYDAMGQPDAVELLYDREQGLIGLQPASLDDEYTVKVRRQGDNKSYLIGARSFCLYYKIDISKTVKFEDVNVDDDGSRMLVLNPAKVTRLEVRGGKRKKVEEPQPVPQRPANPAVQTRADQIFGSGFTRPAAADDDIPF